MNTVEITMVGPRGVGKTSLLTGMYATMRKELNELGGNIWQDAQTAGAMKQCEGTLKELAQGEGVMVVGNYSMLQGQDRTYTLGVVLPGDQNPALKLSFTDLPGGWFAGTGNHQKADDCLANSAFSLIAVDATALMEARGKSGPGRFNDQINRPAVIFECYNRNLPKLKKNKHSALFVLLRAESYADAKNQELMHSLLKVAYADLIELFESNGLTIGAISVETVGGVRFHSFDKDGTAKFVRDKRRNKNAGKDGASQESDGYRPKDCGVPLRWILRRAMERALNGRRAGFFGWLGDLLGNNKTLIQVITKLAKKNEGKIRNLNLVHPTQPSTSGATVYPL